MENTIVLHPESSTLETDESIEPETDENIDLEISPSEESDYF